MDRPLTLERIPDEFLAEYGLRPGGTTRPSCRSSDPNAVLVSLVKLTGRKPEILTSSDATESTARE